MSGAPDFLKKQVSVRTRRKIAARRLQVRAFTAARRMLPELLILGVQRGGTSSLYKYLADHPDLAPSLRKETGYFSRYMSKDEGWYRAHFPLEARARLHRTLLHQPLLGFEATPDYIFHPHAANHCARLLPNARFVLLLRDPVERAVSHHAHMTRLGFETLPLEAALQAETERIGADIRRAEEDPTFTSNDYLRFSYISRGFYDIQLQRWLDRFPRDRFLIRESRDLFTEPERITREVISFLGLRSRSARSFSNHSYLGDRPKPPDIPSSLRDRLEEMYAPHTERLETMLGRSLSFGHP